jgi:hypothetical protein
MPYRILFTPEDISGESDGALVSSVTLSAGGTMTGSGSTRPTCKTNILNGYRVLRFTALDQVLSNTTVIVPKCFVAVAVAKLTTISGTYQRILTSQPDGYFFHGAISGNYATLWGDDGTTWNDLTANSPNTGMAAWGIWSCISDGTSGTPFANGTAMTAKDGDNEAFSAGFKMGALTGTQGWIGDIAAYALCAGANRSLHDTLVGAFAHKFALTALLPSDHPYKSTDPGLPATTFAFDGGDNRSALSRSTGAPWVSAHRISLPSEQSNSMGMGWGRDDSEGNDAPSLKAARYGRFRVRLAVRAGDRELNVQVKQPQAGAVRPYVKVLANAAIGLASAQTATADATTGWQALTIPFTATANGGVVVELWNADPGLPCWWDNLNLS